MSPRFLSISPLEIVAPGFLEGSAQRRSMAPAAMEEALAAYFGTEALSAYGSRLQLLVQLIGEDKLKRRQRELIRLLGSRSFAIRDLWQRHHVELLLPHFCEAQRRGQDEFFAAALAGTLPGVRGPLERHVEAPSPLGNDVLQFANVSTTFHRALSFDGQRRHAGKLKSALDTRQGFAPLRAEYSVFLFFLMRGCHVAAPDLDGSGRYDLLIANSAESFEVECKYVTYELGAKTEGRQAARLVEKIEELFYRELADLGVSVVVRVRVPKRFPSSEGELSRMASAVGAVVRGSPAPEGGFTVKVEHWAQGLEEPSRVHTHAKAINLDEGHHTIGFDKGKSAMVLTLESDLQSDRRLERIRSVLGDGARQLSGSRPGILFVEVEGGLALRPVQEGIRDSLSPLVQDLGAARPSLAAVVVGFPGPPFSRGGCCVIRNPAAEVHASRLRAVQLFETGEGAPTQEPGSAGLFADWKTEWWRRKHSEFFSAVLELREGMAPPTAPD